MSNHSEKNILCPNQVARIYSRQNAIDNGLLIDISSKAKEAGIKAPVAVTKSAWNAFFCVDDNLENKAMPFLSQELERRQLWLVLQTILFTIHTTDSENLDDLTFSVSPISRSAELIYGATATLRMRAKLGDSNELVFTVMLPSDD